MTDIEIGNHELNILLDKDYLTKEINKASLKKAVDSIDVDDGIDDNEMKTILKLIAFNNKKHI